jgi:hypothetical protein
VAAHLRNGGCPLRHFTMTRKESEKDADRTHYYSQFWLDVAAGRRIIGAPKEDEAAEADVLEPMVPLRKSARSVSYADSSDGQFDDQDERIVHPVAEPLATPEEFSDDEADDIDLETDDIETPDLPEEVVDDIDIPDMDLGPAEEEAEDSEEEEEAEDGEGVAPEEEEEEDLGWGGRGRKRNKPVRPKAPPKKAPRREPRRGY